MFVEAVVVGSNIAVGFAFWAIIAISIAVLEVLGRLHRGNLPHLGDLGRFLMQWRIFRWIMVAGWVFAGWHLFSH